MSGWGMGWFGGGGGAATSKKKNAPKDAILQLRSTAEMLSKREKHLQNQIEEQDTMARKYVSTNKAAAKAALRRKKAHEHSLEQTSAQMLTIEREIQSIETANINKTTLDAMKNASAAMKQIHGGLTIDKVDQTMEELRDQHMIGEEIADALTQGALTNNAIDEDDLEEELESMQQEKLENDMLKTGNVPVGDVVSGLPTASNTIKSSKTPVRTEEDEEEEELRKLQAEMAM